MGRQVRFSEPSSTMMIFPDEMVTKKQENAAPLPLTNSSSVSSLSSTFKYECEDNLVSTVSTEAPSDDRQDNLSQRDNLSSPRVSDVESVMSEEEEEIEEMSAQKIDHSKYDIMYEEETKVPQQKMSPNFVVPTLGLLGLKTETTECDNATNLNNANNGTHNTHCPLTGRSSYTDAFMTAREWYGGNTVRGGSNENLNLRNQKIDEDENEMIFATSEEHSENFIFENRNNIYENNSKIKYENQESIFSLQESFLSQPSTTLMLDENNEIRNHEKKKKKKKKKVLCVDT
eukprot:Trichotokara_eunicae@DN5245_c0_g1_i7.p1